MADNRSFFTYLTYSGYRALVTCDSKNIDRTMMANIVADDHTLVYPHFPLETQFVIHNHPQSVSKCLEREDVNLKAHVSVKYSLYNAMRYNRLGMVINYLELLNRQKIDYLLEDNKTPAKTHKDAYLGVGLIELKKMATEPGGKESLRALLSIRDEFGDLTLHKAIAGGHEEYIKFLLEETDPNTYDLNELPIRALESRHASCAHLFMDR